MKFKYSSGLFGYGLKGTDGSAGIPGFGLYFTDYQPGPDNVFITDAIENNEVLWRLSVPGTTLPGSREYMTGELFVDSAGNLYKIDLTLADKFDPMNMKLSTVIYFTTDDNATLSNGFQRYYNIFADLTKDPVEDVSIKYIIDSVYSTESTIDYTSTPSTIYGINPKNYLKIEFVDVDVSSYNPFTVYSSGEFIYDDDYKALAIVRDVDDNTFRIGNVETNGNIREVALTFDVSSLRKNGTQISLNTPVDEVLTNKEFGSNTLFTGVFNDDPDSFIGSSPSGTSFKVEWNLSDFTPDTSVAANLYIYDYDTFPIQSFKTCVCHNVLADSSITITNIPPTGQTMAYYMKIIKDGWARNSAIRKTIVNGAVTRFLTIATPISKTLDASASGLIGGISPYAVTFTNNVDWHVIAPSWTSINPTAGTSSTHTFDVSVCKNTTLGEKFGDIVIDSSGYTPPQTIYITQDASESVPSLVTVQFNDAGNIVFTNLSSATASVTFTLHTGARAYSPAPFAMTARSELRLYKNSMYLKNVQSYAYSKANGDITDSDYTSYIVSGILSSDTVFANAYNKDCDYNSGCYADSSMYAMITNATISVGTISIGTYNGWILRHVDAAGGDCTELRYRTTI